MGEKKRFQQINQKNQEGLESEEDERIKTWIRQWRSIETFGKEVKGRFLEVWANTHPRYHLYLRVKKKWWNSFWQEINKIIKVFVTQKNMSRSVELSWLRRKAINYKLTKKKKILSHLASYFSVFTNLYPLVLYWLLNGKALQFLLK